MSIFLRLLLLLLTFGCQTVYASHCGGCEGIVCQKCDNCCQHMGGISYCDSSAGRIVCNNGFYSSCYCTRHAVMDLTHIQGCCLWQGGVLTIDEPTGFVICNNGGISAICSPQPAPEPIATW